MEFSKLRAAFVMIMCYTGLAIGIGVGWWLVRGAHQPWLPDFSRGLSGGIGVAAGTWLGWGIRKRRQLRRRRIEPEVFE